MQKNKQFIVLDLDETLIHSFEDKFSVFEDLRLRGIEHLETRVYMIDFILGGERLKRWGVVRPDVDHFIDYCFERFDKVIVWSAASYPYVHHICDVVFQNRKPHAILTQDDCQNVGGYITNKPLDVLYNRFDEINETNTYIVDDNDSVTKLNDRNAIQVPGYTVNVRETDREEETIRKIIDDSDKALSDLVRWFDRDTSRHSNVQNIPKPKMV